MGLVIKNLRKMKENMFLDLYDNGHFDMKTMSKLNKIYEEQLNKLPQSI